MTFQPMGYDKVFQQLTNEYEFEYVIIEGVKARKRGGINYEFIIPITKESLLDLKEIQNEVSKHKISTLTIWEKRYLIDSVKKYNINTAEDILNKCLAFIFIALITARGKLNKLSEEMLVQLNRLKRNIRM